MAEGAGAILVIEDDGDTRRALASLVGAGVRPAWIHRVRLAEAS